MKTVLLTVATDPENPYFQNWLKSTKKAGWSDFQIQVLGINERWQGWTWRCEKIVDALRRLDPRDLVIFCDSYDLLVFGSPTEFQNVHLSCDCDILLGMDYACMDQNSELLGLKPNCSGSLAPNRLLFVNGGGIMGWAKDLLKAYVYIAKHHQDDQIGWYDYLKHHLPQGTKVRFDEQNQMVFNFVFGDHAHPDKHLGVYAKYVEMLFNPWKTMRVIKESDGRPYVKYQYPLMIHTPGIKADGGARYNYIGKKFLKESFQSQGLQYTLLTTLAYLPLVIIIAVIVYFNVSKVMGNKSMKQISKR